MQVHQIYTKSMLRNYTYLIQCEGNHFYCLDPWNLKVVSEVVDEAGGDLVAVINTHEHWDHIQGNDAVVAKYGSEIWAHENGKGKIPNVSRFLQKGDRIEIEEDCFLVVMDTPGHTFAHLCLLLEERGNPVAVFTGDTLFNAGVGNCHNGGDPETLYKTVSEQFQNMHDEVLVYPGHDYLGNNLKFTLDREPGNELAREMLDECEKIDFPKQKIVTKMACERQINTFLRLENNEIVSRLKGDTSNDKQVFLRLRELRNKW